MRTAGAIPTPAKQWISCDKQQIEAVRGLRANGMNRTHQFIGCIGSLLLLFSAPLPPKVLAEEPISQADDQDTMAKLVDKLGVCTGFYSAMAMMYDALELPSSAKMFRQQRNGYFIAGAEALSFYKDWPGESFVADMESREEIAMTQFLVMLETNPEEFTGEFARKQLADCAARRTAPLWRRLSKGRLGVW